MTNTLHGATGARNGARRLACAALVLTAITIGPAASATQHLITAGDPWQDVAASARPGDEIILMPGQHKRAVLTGLQGTADAPIVIRSADPDNHSTIVAEGEGLRLLQASHVTIRDLIIKGGTISGISIEHHDNPLSMPTTAGGERWDGAIKIINVSVLRTGPSGERHGIRCIGTRNIEIRNCRIEGWGGAAIEIQGCERVDVERCTLRGLMDFSQRYGIRIRGGSTEVTVDQCRIEDAGSRVFCLGGSTKLEHFIPSIAAEAPTGSVHEASRVRLTRNIVSGGRVPFTFDRTRECVVRNNTIVGPQECIIAIHDASELDDQRLGVIDRTLFGYNMVVWEPDALKTHVHCNDPALLAGLNIEPNLWWSPAPMIERAKLGPLPGPEKIEQITEIDPKLDDDLQPTAIQAGLFGSDAP